MAGELVDCGQHPGCLVGQQGEAVVLVGLCGERLQVTLWKESLEGKWHQVADVLDKQ
jgi:hypothetical protein